MMQSAEPFLGQDATATLGTKSVVGRSLPQSEMRAVFMVVADVFRKQSLQMAFIHRNDVIEQVSAAAFDPTLRDAVLPGTFERGADRPHLQGSNRCRNFKSPLLIPIKDQEPLCRCERKGFPQLLHDPQAGRVLGHIEVQNPPAVMGNDEGAAEHAERDRGNRKQVHRGNSFPMVTQKGEPTLGRLWVPRRSFHPAGNRSLRDVETEHEQLAMNARRAPSRILGHHPEDQLPHLLRRLFSPDGLSDSRDQPPIRPKTGPVPTDHRLERHDDESLLPFWPSRRTVTQKSLSSALSIGRGCRRFSAASCWRRTKFSRTKLL
jgi:hypothetical protein